VRKYLKKYRRIFPKNDFTVRCIFEERFFRGKRTRGKFLGKRRGHSQSEGREEKRERQVRAFRQLQTRWREENGQRFKQPERGKLVPEN